jgi:uncharacterized protein
MGMNSDNRQLTVAVIALGVCLLIGLTTAGYFIGKGAARFKSDSRTVSVKGLVEKEVKADKAIWNLSLRYASNNLKDAHTKISADREATIAFIRSKGFKDEEIERQPTQTIDKAARDYGQQQASDRIRYVVATSVIVKTNNVDQVRAALGATEELLKSGVILDGEREGGVANPRYIISSFNTIRPQLLAEATKNARATAQQFASDSGATVGRIRSANQGMIQIFGSDGNDESGPYSPTSTIIKKIRVVSTFEFDLQ